MKDTLLESRELSRKYQYLLLEKLSIDTSNENREATDLEKENIFKKAEALCDDILKGNIEKQEKEFLESLPDAHLWNKYKDFILDLIKNSNSSLLSLN